MEAGDTREPNSHGGVLLEGKYSISAVSLSTSVVEIVVLGVAFGVA